MLVAPKTRVTMGEIARRLNVTISTVSRAIHEPRKISEETREKVMELVKELNYVPNSAARTLKTNKTGILGYLYNREHPFSDQITPMRIFEALEIEAQGCGYHMALASVLNGSKEPKLPLMVEERRVDGIFLGGQMDIPLITKLMNNDIPLVLLGNYARDIDVACVIQDDIGGAYKAVKHFIDLGHKRIAFIGAPLDNLWSWERLQGMRLALEEHNIPLNNNYVYTNDAWSGKTSVSMLLELSMPPTAILCASDRLARTVMDAALEKRVSIPDEISIAGFDDEPWASHSIPPLTTVSIFPEMMASAAIEKMTGLVDRKTVPSRIVTPTKLVVRGSSGTPAKQ